MEGAVLRRQAYQGIGRWDHRRKGKTQHRSSRINLKQLRLFEKSTLWPLFQL
jgi:hypothetical protein